ncbi:MAG: ABC transporter ATP-binding protein [Actinobacteria bacterium]|nr:ABC transporter ATP-binding protein [Actinomycetota bacterium]
MEAAVIFSNVTKKYRIVHDKNPSLKETIIHLKRSTYEDFLALDNLSFKVQKGETFGIIGPNGSGKSTALKLLSRIMLPTSGKIEMDGTVSALLELGAGFHPDLTGKENIYLNAAILGLDSRFVAEKFDEIVRFAELEKFIDTPVKNYSSGMYVRLGFAIAVNVNPDILLVDEVLTVGDQAFQAKCLERIYDFMRSGKTIMIVSHDLDMISNICNRALFLYQGKKIKEAAAAEAVREYRSFIEESELEKESASLGIQESSRLLQSAERFGSGEAEIHEVYLEDKNGKSSAHFRSGDDTSIVMKVKFYQDIDDPIFGIRITNELNMNTYGTNTYIKGKRTGKFKKNEEREIIFRQPLTLIKGKYFITAAVGHRDGKRYYDWRTNIMEFTVVDEESSEGIANLNSEIVIN